MILPALLFGKLKIYLTMYTKYWYWYWASLQLDGCESSKNAVGMCSITVYHSRLVFPIPLYKYLRVCFTRNISIDILLPFSTVSSYKMWLAANGRVFSSHLPPLTWRAIILMLPTSSKALMSATRLLKCSTRTMPSWWMLPIRNWSRAHSARTLHLPLKSHPIKSPPHPRLSLVINENHPSLKVSIWVLFIASCLLNPAESSKEEESGVDKVQAKQSKRECFLLIPASDPL